MMEQLIAYSVMVPCTDPLHCLQLPHLHERESDNCTVEQWERERKREVHERWDGTGYKVSVWPPQKWWRRGNDTQ